MYTVCSITCPSLCPQCPVPLMTVSYRTVSLNYKIPGFSVLLPCTFHPRKSLAASDLLTVSAALLFPECHKIGIIQYAVFFGLASFIRSMHFSFIHLFCGLITHFFLLPNNTPLPGCSTVCSSLAGHFDCFWFWQLRIKLL